MALSSRFLEDLKNGILSPLLQHVKNDGTLDMEFRDPNRPRIDRDEDSRTVKGYLNIYYRGGQLLKLQESSSSKYSASFDKKYDMAGMLEKVSIPFPQRIPDIPTSIVSMTDIENWINAFSLLKLHMDYYFSIKKSCEEREAQQMIVRENNRSRTSNDTDFYIIDIEHAEKGNSAAGRMDMVGIHWPSTRTEHRKNSDHGLALFEVKYGDQKMGGKCGLAWHYRNTAAFVESPDFAYFKEGMVDIFNQKIELGLINERKSGIQDFGDRLTYIVVAVNHKPASTAFANELRQIVAMNLPLEVGIIWASPIGLGLYDKEMLTISETLQRIC